MEFENENVQTVNTENSSEKSSSRKPKGRVRIGKIIAAALVITGLGLGGKACFDYQTNKTPDFEITANEILGSIEDETTLDEICDIVNPTGICDLDELVEIVELSERLHDLDLSQYTSELTKYDLPDEYSISDVNEMIDEFEELLKNEKVQNGVLSTEDRDFTRLALTLEAYERAVNGSLDNEAYQTLVDIAIPVVKSKVTDACGFDASEVGKMKIGANSTAYIITFIDDTGKEYNIKAKEGSSFSSCGYVHNVISDIYDWQNQTMSSTDTGNSYNAERNNSILDGVNEVKSLMLMNCEINNKSQIVVTTSMSDVKEQAKSLTKTSTEATKQ